MVALGEARMNEAPDVQKRTRQRLLQTLAHGSVRVRPGRNLSKVEEEATAVKKGRRARSRQGREGDPYRHSNSARYACAPGCLCLGSPLPIRLDKDLGSKQTCCVREEQGFGTGFARS